MVSIHAPVRERPRQFIRDCAQWAVSIHAPVRERLVSDEILPAEEGFNSRSREGATSDWKYFLVAEYGVSIHAPVRERLR